MSNLTRKKQFYEKYDKEVKMKKYDDKMTEVDFK